MNEEVKEALAYAYSEALEEDPSEERLKTLYRNLPGDIILKSAEWGWEELYSSVVEWIKEGEYERESDSPYPLISFTKLYHVGTLNPENKGSDSHEGSGLSVSVHPNEWTRIAKLGGGDLYSLSKSGNQFLDFHRMTDDEM